MFFSKTFLSIVKFENFKVEYMKFISILLNTFLKAYFYKFHIVFLLKLLYFDPKRSLRILDRSNLFFSVCLLFVSESEFYPLIILNLKNIFVMVFLELLCFNYYGILKYNLFFKNYQKSIITFDNFKLRAEFNIFVFLQEYVAYFKVFKYNEYLDFHRSVFTPGLNLSKMIKRRYLFRLQLYQWIELKHPTTDRFKLYFRGALFFDKFSIYSWVTDKPEVYFNSNFVHSYQKILLDLDYMYQFLKHRRFVFFFYHIFKPSIIYLFNFFSYLFFIQNNFWFTGTKLFFDQRKVFEDWKHIIKYVSPKKGDFHSIFPIVNASIPFVYFYEQSFIKFVHEIFLNNFDFCNKKLLQKAYFNFDMKLTNKDVLLYNVLEFYLVKYISKRFFFFLTWSIITWSDFINWCRVFWSVNQIIFVKIFNVFSFLDVYLDLSLLIFNIDFLFWEVFHLYTSKNLIFSKDQTNLLIVIENIYTEVFHSIEENSFLFFEESLLKRIFSKGNALFFFQWIIFRDFHAKKFAYLNAFPIHFLRSLIICINSLGLNRVIGYVYHNQPLTLKNLHTGFIYNY